MSLTGYRSKLRIKAQNFNAFLYRQRERERKRVEQLKKLFVSQRNKMFYRENTRMCDINLESVKNSRLYKHRRNHEILDRSKFTHSFPSYPMCVYTYIDIYVHDIYRQKIYTYNKGNYEHRRTIYFYPDRITYPHQYLLTSSTNDQERGSIGTSSSNPIVLSTPKPHTHITPSSLLLQNVFHPRCHRVRDDNFSRYIESS